MKNRYFIWGGIFPAIILIAGGYYFSQEQIEPGHYPSGNIALEKIH